ASGNGHHGTIVGPTWVRDEVAASSPAAPAPDAGARDSLPADHVLSILPIAVYQSHLNLSDEQRQRIDQLVMQFQEQLGVRAADVTTQQVAEDYAKRLEAIIDPAQLVELTSMQRF